ncbi:MAG: T9SS type A sorting domain-containing protein [Bacteroidetes bacterium]|nr:T9SS type A sorting domain-containing protein [Bacteroidota bacterium]
MKKIFTFSVIFLLCLSSARLYAGADTLACSVFCYTKASVGCHSYVSYSGTAPSSAAYHWDFDGGAVVSGSGQGPYYIIWDNAGYKTITLNVFYQGDSCHASRSIHIIPAPTVYNVTGGGSYPVGGSGVTVGLSGSQPHFNYYLFLNNTTQSIANKTGDGNPLNFGLFTTAGTYYCKAKVDSSSSSCLVNMHDSAVVTISGYVPPPYICMVTFDTTTQRNKIVWNKITGYHLAHYNVFRQTSRENVFAKIGEVAYNSFSAFVDTTTNPIVIAQKYELSVTDSAGNESVTCPYHKTVHLEVSPGVQGFNLIWNSYEGFTFYTYLIHRKLNQGSWMLLDSVASDQISYTDPYVQPGLMTYYIEVIRNSPCYPSLKSGNYESVISNSMTAAALGINDGNSQGISAYPNPVHDKMIVMLPVSGSNNAELEVWSMDGRKFSEQTVSEPKTEINLSKLLPGMYFIRVISKDITGTFKFVKE